MQIYHSNHCVLCIIFITLGAPKFTCSQCGAEERPTSKFCSECGASLRNTPAVVSDAAPTFPSSVQQQQQQQQQVDELKEVDTLPPSSMY